MEESKDYEYRGVLRSYFDVEHNAVSVLTLNKFRHRFGLAGPIGGC